MRIGKRLLAGQEKWKLYNLSKEISEETNLAEANPEKLVELIAIWEKMNDAISEALF